MSTGHGTFVTTEPISFFTHSGVLPSHPSGTSPPLNQLGSVMARIGPLAASTKLPRPRGREERPSPYSFPASQKQHDVEVIGNRYQMVQIDADTILMLPLTYDQFDREADCEWGEGPSMDRAWKSVIACEFLQEHHKIPHPRLAEFKGRDPWTALPLFKTPSGPSLGLFLDHHQDNLYTTYGSSSKRPHSAYAPIFYQWILQVASTLQLLHGQGIVVGDWDNRNWWLSLPDLTLRYVGFYSAKFQPHGNVYPYISDYDFPNNPRHPLHIDDYKTMPNVATDLVLFGFRAYELLTQSQPGWGPGETEGEWPDLEAEYLGDIVQKCKMSRYQDVDELMSDIVGDLESRGWSVDGDRLVGLDVQAIMGDKMKASYRFNWNQQ